MFVFFFLGDRTVLLNDTEHQIDFKSHQWFGATVRSHGDTILVRRPSNRSSRGLGREGLVFQLYSTSAGALCCYVWGFQ